MRGRDACAVSTLRLILAAIKDRDIAARPAGHTEGIADEEILDLLQKLIRLREESIVLYEQGGRLELAELEPRELEVIRTFLLKKRDEGALGEPVREVVVAIGALRLNDLDRWILRLRTP